METSKTTKIIAGVLAIVLTVGVAIGGGVLLSKANAALDSIMKDSTVTDSTGDNTNAGSTGTGDNAGGSTGDNTGAGDSTGAGNNSSGSVGDSTGDSTGGSAETVSYITEEIVMEAGAALSFNDESTSETYTDNMPSISWTAIIPSMLKEEWWNQGAITLHYITAPLETLEKINPAWNDIDWVAALEKGEYQYENNKLAKEWDSTSTTATKGTISELADGTFRVRFRKWEVVTYEEVNTGFLTIPYLIRDGQRQYARVDKTTCTRSVAYVASAALANYQLCAITRRTLPFGEETAAKYKNVINKSVDLANGMAEPTDNDSTYEFVQKYSEVITLAVGDTLKLDVSMTPNAKLVAFFVPMELIDSGLVMDEYSYSTDILTVSTDGTVEAQKKGRGAVIVLCGGARKTVLFNVM